MTWKTSQPHSTQPLSNFPSVFLNIPKHISAKRKDKHSKICSWVLMLTLCSTLPLSMTAAPTNAIKSANTSGNKSQYIQSVRSSSTQYTKRNDVTHAITLTNNEYDISSHDATATLHNLTSDGSNNVGKSPALVLQHTQGLTSVNINTGTSLNTSVAVDRTLHLPTSIEYLKTARLEIEGGNTNGQNRIQKAHAKQYHSKVNGVENVSVLANFNDFPNSLTEWNFAKSRSYRETKGKVSLLGLFELSTRFGARPEGHSELAAALMAVRHINSRELLPGYSLELLTNDTKCDPGVGVDRFFHALYTQTSTRMVMLLGSACSEVTESLAKVVPYWNIVQVSFGSTSPALSDRREFPLFYRTVAPDSSHNPARIAFIRRFGWDTVTALSQNEEVYSLAVNDLVTELEHANITCAATITFAETDFKDQLRMLRDLDTRIIIGSFSHQVAPKIFCEAYQLGMFGADYAWILQGPPNPTWWENTSMCPQSHLLAAVERLIIVSSHNSIVGSMPSYSGLTNAMFTSELESLSVPVTQYAPQTYDAVWAIALALRGAEQAWLNTTKRGAAEPLRRLAGFDYTRKDMAIEFLQQLGQLNFLGVSGPVSFSGADRVGTSAFYQIQDGEVRGIALFYPEAGQLDFRCPHCIPVRWQSGQVPIARRVFKLRVETVEPAAFLTIACVASVGITLAIAFLAFNLHFRKLKSIKLSSPRLSNMTAVGCILVYAAVILLGIDHGTLPSESLFPAVCTARVYLLSAGFSLAFGSMFTKTYRVHRIFTRSRGGVCKEKLLQDTQLISLICVLLLVDGLIVTLWVVVDPMERYLSNLTLEISAIDRSVVYQPQVEVCRSLHSHGWLGALYAYKGLLLIVGVYMAWETRHVKIPALNDSQYIGVSVYSVVITSGIVVVLANLISERVTLAFVTITALILISTTATLSLLFLPKLNAILGKNDNSDPVIHSMGLKIECNTRRFVNDDRRELQYRVEVQNRVYRREMAALDAEICKLERMLLDSSITSNSSSNDSLAGNGKGVFATLEEISLKQQEASYHPRTPSIGGGLPLLLLSVLPPVIPRASWPCAEHGRFPMRRSVCFSSQPKLNDGGAGGANQNGPAIDLLNLCLTHQQSDGRGGFIQRIKSLFGTSKPPSRKTSTASFAASNSGVGLAAALKVHMGMLAGLVPGASRNHLAASCHTLDARPTMVTRDIRRQSLARSGPTINILTDQIDTIYDHEGRKQSIIYSINQRDLEIKTNCDSEPRVNFILPAQRKMSTSHQHLQPILSFRERARGSPRFPHKIVPTSSLTALEDGTRKGSTNTLQAGNHQSINRRSSQQHLTGMQKHKTSDAQTMGVKWKSMEDATLTVPGVRRGSGVLAMSYIPSDVFQPRAAPGNHSAGCDVWRTAEFGIPLSELENNKGKRNKKNITLGDSTNS